MATMICICGARWDFGQDTDEQRNRCGECRRVGSVKSGLFVRYSRIHARTLNAMRQRCENDLCPSFKNYGGRGIQVCAAWRMYRQGLRNFILDMGPRPSDAHSIDRIDNTGDYEPGNCRWATRSEQNRNRRYR